MVTFNQSAPRRVLSLRHIVALAVFLSFAPIGHVAFGQDMISDEFESAMYRPWWNGLWFHGDGSPRYGNGFANSSRNHQYRLPVRPPVCGPSFGYYQPCWRQLPMVRRCVTCETFPSNREFPALNGTQDSSPTQIPEVPPTPEAPAAVESAPKTSETVPY